MDHEADQRARRASSFGSEADAYARYRPGYPVALLEWGLAPVRDADGLRVLDLAAGTGKITEGLVGLDVDVIAVEPDTAMLAQLTSRFPKVDARSGTAESIPLPDASVDVVFVGQALHWFDLDRALPEIDRVLRPGGSLVAAWNLDDDRVPWVAELSALSEAPIWNGELPEHEAAVVGFGTVEQQLFPHPVVQTVDSLVGTLMTYSRMLTSTPERRAKVDADVRRFLLANPATAHEFTMPMITLGLRVTP
jgi:SAM-dependent methyltransferase